MNACGNRMADIVAHRKLWESLSKAFSKSIDVMKSGLPRSSAPYMIV
jgi:hypothetical protein